LVGLLIHQRKEKREREREREKKGKETEKKKKQKRNRAKTQAHADLRACDGDRGGQLGGQAASLGGSVAGKGASLHHEGGSGGEPKGSAGGSLVLGKGCVQHRHRAVLREDGPSVAACRIAREHRRQLGGQGAKDSAHATSVTGGTIAGGEKRRQNTGAEAQGTMEREAVLN